MSESPVARGGCLCGGVRFEVHGPLASHHLLPLHHVPPLGRSFRRRHRLRARALAPAVRAVTALVSIFRDRSAGFLRHLRLGSFWEPAHGGHTSIWAGTLDTPTGLKPSMHIFVAEKGDYYEITDGLPQWPEDSPPD